MSSDHLFFTSKRDTSIDEQDLSNEAECLTFEARNKILAGHLDFSSKVDYLVSSDKLPTHHEAQLVLTSLESSKLLNLEMI
ncbi:hypothetical protein SLE2022_211040 [Rubroshorea leprosula]